MEMAAGHMMAVSTEMAAEYMTAARTEMAVDYPVEGTAPSFCSAVCIEPELPVLLVENCPENCFPFVEYDPSGCSVISTYTPTYYPAY